MDIVKKETCMSGVEFIDPIESTDTYEWRCRRCGDYIISRAKPLCENCDGARGGPDIVPCASHERRHDG